jgi:hypothetical protein
MAITNAQQARQMYKEGSEKPVTQAGVKNFLGKQEMVKAPKFWLSEPGHVKAKLAYITDEEEKILIDKNLYGSLKGKPNKGPAGLPSLQGGDFGSEDAGTGDSQGGGDKGNTGKGRDLDFQQRGMTKGDYATGRGANRGGDRDQNFGGRQNFAQRAFSGIKDYITSGGMIGAIGRGLTNFSNKFGKTTAANLADRYGYGPDYQGTIGPSSVDDDDDDNGRGGGIPLYVQLGFPSQAAYLASLQRAQSAPTPAPTTTQDPFIAYRFMAEGGIADTEVARQNYFVGGIIKKATKAVKKIGSKVNRTRKKLLKNPYVQTAIALYAPYAAAGSGFMAGASPFMRQAVISGLTTGGLQLASGQDLDAKGILKSAALSGALATMAPAQGAQATSTGAQKAATVDYSDMSKFNELGLGGSGGAANIQGGIPSANVFDYESAAYGIKPLETSKFTDMVNAQALEKVDPKVVDAISKTDPEKLSKFAEIAKKIDDSKIGGALLGDGKGGISALKAIGIASALPLLGVGAPEEEDEGEPYRGEGIDIAAIRRDPYSYTAPRFMAEGGDVEPVAKKTMPLLDLDGKEMDLRAEGGFVPIGRMEKADDVPARLSKNEFVFTAEAVRNAGDGDIDKGAEVMYNMMKNLEAGGDVSEESQGLDGARNMFQTSQRLGEVI